MAWWVGNLGIHEWEEYRGYLGGFIGYWLPTEASGLESDRARLRSR